MKVACTGSHLFAAGATTIEEKIALASSLGYDGIQLSYGSGCEIDPSCMSLRDTGDIVPYSRAHGIVFSCMDIGTVEIEDLDGATDYIIESICMAHALDVPLVRIASPLYGDEKAFLARYDSLVKIYQDALEFAEDFEVCVGIYPSPGTCIATFDNAIDFVDDVERMLLGCVYAPGRRGEIGDGTIKAAWEEGKDYVVMIALDTTSAEEICAGVYDELLRVAHAAGFAHFITYSEAGFGNASAARSALVDVQGYLARWRVEAEGESDAPKAEEELIEEEGGEA